ncbi:MAG: MATE family efflux transporter [Provencibacterium sp.]|jgi:putative MATE family efflux protein|nr:MATE family efflux transporter [Provencibacterium sp.]
MFRQSVQEENGITEGIIWKQLLIFFFPILFGTFFQQLYNTVDAIVVGQFVGKEALAAVGGATGTLINLLVGFFTGLSSGATVIISQFYGAQKGEEVSRTVHSAVALCLAGGVLFTVTGNLCASWALRAMGTPENILGGALTYLRVYFSGIIFPLIYNMGSGILRAVGDSRRPLYFLIVCCMVNLALDLLFVAVFRWGVLGVAVATLVSQAISAALVILALIKTDRSYHFDPHQIRFHTDLLKKIIRIGLPAGLQSVMYGLSNIVIQSAINAFGTDVMAAWTAYGKIDGFFWMLMSAFGVSVTTFVGQNFGAQSYGRIRKSVRVSSGMALGTSLTLSVLLYFFGPYVYRLFTSDPVVIEQGMLILRTLTPTYFTYVAIEILAGAVRGTGDALIPMLITGIGVCVLRIVWIALAVPVWPEVRTVVLSYPITWSVTSVLFILYYLQGGWLRRQIAKAGYAPEVR